LTLAANLAALTASLAAVGCRPTWVPAGEPADATAGAPKARVAVAQAQAYDRALIKQQVQALVEGLPGAGEVFKPGTRAALKVNLTSGAHFQPPPGLTAPESYVTHPEVVRALGELLLDGGVTNLVIVEAVYDAQSFARWGYESVARDLGAALIDLNLPPPNADFVSVSSGPSGSVYETFAVHPVLTEIDTLISVAKLKCHSTCGVTLSMKNLVGLLPVSRYRLSPDHWWRSALHGAGEETATRLPGSGLPGSRLPGSRLAGVILDLQRAMPVHLAVIDGVLSAEGGEVPRGSFHPRQPGVLIAGKNPVTADAVGTAVMGFDPLDEPSDPPCLRSPNYLTMARRADLGTNDLREIEVAGPAIDEIQAPFQPAWEM
jgi:uncharacterized protein (DUF362 family)